MKKNQLWVRCSVTSISLFLHFSCPLRFFYPVMHIQAGKLLCLRNTPASALLQSRSKLSLERCLLRFSFLLSTLRQIAEEVAPGAALRHRSLAAEPVAVLYFLLICTAWACHCSSSETSELRHILKAHFHFGLKWLITSSKKTSHNRSVYWKSSNALLRPLPVWQTHVHQDPFFPPPHPRGIFSGHKETQSLSFIDRIILSWLTRETLGEILEDE